MITLNKLFEDYVVTNHGGVVERAAITAAYEIFLGLTGDFEKKEERIAYWEAKNISAENFAEQFLTEAEQLNAKNAEAYGETTGDRRAVVSAAREAAKTGDIEAIRQKVADVVASQPGEGEQPGVPSETLSLTAGRDTLTGTANDDVFTANVVQNDFGNLVNSLATGDVIEGNGGNNILKAQLINAWGGQGQNDILAVMPMTNNVQTAEFQALNMGGAVTVDAVHMNGTNHYTSVNSRGDLNIVNVRIENTQMTEDITLEMRNTVAHNTPGAAGITGSDLNVWFEQTSLRAAPDRTDADAEFFIELADAQQDNPAAPLANVRITDLKITHDGNVIELQNIESTDDTYQGLVEAIQAALDAAGFGDRYKATLGTDFNEVNGVATQVPGFKVVVEDTKQPAVAFTEDDVLLGVGNKLGVGGSATVLGDSGFDSFTDTTKFKVTSNVILDNVGMGSHGGNVFVGSMSDSESSTGIQVFNVEVRNDSNIGEITTTTTADQTTSRFDELHITNGDGFSGNLVLRNESNALDGTTINGGDLIKAEGMEGNLTLGTVEDITNVDVIDAVIAGNVTLNATYTTENATAAGATPADAKEYVIKTGSGNDVIEVLQEGQTTSTSTQTTTKISSTGGHNTITVRGENSTVINTAGGNDTIFLEGTGGTAAVYNIASTAFASTVLYKATVAISFAGYETTAEIETDANGKFIATQAQYNAAIMKAIDDSPQLSRLLNVQEDGQGGLTITSNTVGDYGDLEIDVTQPVLGTGAGEVAAPTGNALNALKQGIIQLEPTKDSSHLDDLSKVNAELGTNGAITTGAFNDDTTAEVGTGTDATGVVTGTIDAGLGHDVIALGTTTGQDTIVISNASASNKLTILNFEGGAAGDVLDFSQWLKMEHSPSGSTLSSRTSDVQLANDLSTVTFTAVTTGHSNNNLVTILDWSDLVNDGTGGSLAAGTAFSASNFNAAALNFAVDTTGLTAVATNNIFLIENDGASGNAGEYLVVKAETSDAAGATSETLTSVQVVGTLDFGDTFSGTWAVDNFQF